MKTNLDSLFKTDVALEKDGIWFDINEKTAFLVRRFGGSNAQKVKLAMAKYHKPKARLIELDQLSTEESTSIMIKVFVSACLVDWKGVEVDGKEIPCNPENAYTLFKNLPELFTSLFDYAQGTDSYKEDLGNS